MKIQISDPRPKTSVDLQASYDAGYARYPLDHPVTASLLIVSNLSEAEFDVLAYYPDHDSGAVIGSVLTKDFFVKPIADLPVGTYMIRVVTKVAGSSYRSSSSLFYNYNAPELSNEFDLDNDAILGAAVGIAHLDEVSGTMFFTVCDA